MNGALLGAVSCRLLSLSAVKFRVRSCCEPCFVLEDSRTPAIGRIGPRLANPPSSSLTSGSFLVLGCCESSYDVCLLWARFYFFLGKYLGWAMARSRCTSLRGFIRDADRQRASPGSADLPPLNVAIPLEGGHLERLWPCLIGV